MVKIQVLGNGLIPRIGQLAPITEPFPVGRMVAATILQTSPNLTVNYFNPKDGTFHQLTKQNITRVFDEYEDDETPVTADAPTTDSVKTETNRTDETTSNDHDQNEIRENEKSDVVQETSTTSTEPETNEEVDEDTNELTPVESRNGKKKKKH